MRHLRNTVENNHLFSLLPDSCIKDVVPCTSSRWVRPIS
jgi:hypothetical protein